MHRKSTQFTKLEERQHGAQQPTSRCALCQMGRRLEEQMAQLEMKPFWFLGKSSFPSSLVCRLSVNYQDRLMTLISTSNFFLLHKFSHRAMTSIVWNIIIASCVLLYCTDCRIPSSRLLFKLSAEILALAWENICSRIIYKLSCEAWQ